MTYEQLIASLDWAAINAKVLAMPLLSQADRADLASMLLKACKKWVAPDTESLTVIGVEERFLLDCRPGHAIQRMFAGDEAELSLGPYGVKGYIDLIGYGQQIQLFDWKCTGSISEDQQNRLRDSWQWKLYCFATGATQFTYRSIQRDGRTKDTVLRWPGGGYDNADVEQHLRSVQILRESQQYHDVWPRHAPFACRAYGRDCDYVRQCRTNTAPRQLIQLRPLSHSRMDTLLLCPERYRLDMLATEQDRTETALGKAFHVAAAEMYGQIAVMQQQEKAA